MSQAPLLSLQVQRKAFGPRTVLQALQDAGAHCLVLAPQLSPVATEGGRQFAVQQQVADFQEVGLGGQLVDG